jgi:hypothetical protein
MLKPEDDDNWPLPSGEMIVMTYHALYPLAAVGTHIGILA